MGSVLAVSERGVTFRSYDGSAIELTPESSARAQKALGADIIIPLDELPPLGVSRERLAQSVALSHRWMERSLDEHLREPRAQAMYAVVHGGPTMSCAPRRSTSPRCRLTGWRSAARSARTATRCSRCCGT